LTTGDNGNKAKSKASKYYKYLFTLEGQRTIILVVTLLAITLIMSSGYFSFYSVIDKGVSTQSIIAYKTIEVIDEKETQKKKQEEASRIKPVLKPAEGNVEESITKNLDELLAFISELRSSPKEKPLAQLVQGTRLESFNKQILSYLSHDATDYTWNKVIEPETKKILQSVLTRKLTEDDLREGKNELIRSYLKRSISDENSEAIVAIVSSVLDQPNYVVDQEATNAARKVKMETIEPVIAQFEKGQVVLNKDQKLEPKHYEALRKLGITVKQIEWSVVFGIFCLSIIAIYIVWYYLSRHEPKIANSPRYLSLISVLVIITLILIRLVPYLSRLFHFDIPIYIVPVASVTLILSFFINARVSLLVTAMILLIVGVVFHFPIEAISVLLVGIIAAIFESSKMRYYRDFSLIECGINVGLAQLLVVLCNYFITNNLFYDVAPQELFVKGSIALFSGFLTGAVTIVAMPYLEAIFKIITAHGLMELADQNQPLLRLLQFEAPGTYHHSLMVSTLAEAAAEAIGASTILVRVGAFYHDIGKLKRPSYFIENQTYFAVENPHDKLNPKLSKMVLSAHVKDGLDLAKQYKLPKALQDMINEHHGDGVMLYFYRTAVEAEGEDKIQKEHFRYTGPKPSTKESAIIMLSDATESAVRSLKNPSVTAVEEMVMKIINERLTDDQLSDSPLTLQDIKIISQTFIRILKGMQHHRIDYHETILKELGDKQLEQAKAKVDKLEKSKEAEQADETVVKRIDSKSKQDIPKTNK
jgi:putative nucleotidyltransferase with HDIG domain